MISRLSALCDHVTPRSRDIMVEGRCGSARLAATWSCASQTAAAQRKARQPLSQVQSLYGTEVSASPLTPTKRHCSAAVGANPIPKSRTRDPPRYAPASSASFTSRSAGVISSVAPPAPGGRS
eukprot:1138045-Rhodomonas_salina.1